MPESRDILAQVDDLMVVYSPFRPSPESFQILADEEIEEIRLARLPFRWGDIPMSGTRGQMGLSGIRRSGGRNMYVSPATPTGCENAFPGRRRVRARGRGSVLPSWYPRTPLRDVTSVMRAIERRRARLGEDESQTPPSASTFDAHLDHQEDDESIVTPQGKLIHQSGTKVAKLLLNTSTNEDFLTPQKKLINSIVTVEKVMMEEMQKLKRTPTAKIEERGKKVRTLMSMR